MSSRSTTTGLAVSANDEVPTVARPVDRGERLESVPLWQWLPSRQSTPGLTRASQLLRIHFSHPHRAVPPWNSTANGRIFSLNTLTGCQGPLCF